MNDLPICVTCGVQYAAPRDDCPICEDERQYVGWGGQRWTTLRELRRAGHRARIEEEGPDVIGIGAEPPTAIGQRALLIGSRGGGRRGRGRPPLGRALPLLRPRRRRAGAGGR
ncbi:hypothetical protein TBS_13470 [Thermobispora bispora]|uniref:Uncharacterized protein n=1 Tax=Thermobispora bispora (strain ATCC 19993 / DSM 43833 / CBS 139.67 / JCM 10125 / KCTC 9307 / NBRC 14880 / R51) TaxID=469371 RepID=D6Y3U9_THEBD|nr:hypothetical protein Tbis_2342 [Thermobispora bispora DSM 43833]